MKKHEYKPSSEDVIAYLKENQDFFSNNRDALLALNVDNNIAGVSLLSAKQAKLLRQQLTEAEHQFLDLVGTVRVNEKTSILMHKMSLALLSALAAAANLGLAERMRLLDMVCAAVFKRHMHDVVMSLHWFAAFIGDESAAPASIVDEHDQRITPLINNVFSTGKAYYGPFSQAERTVLLDRFQRKAQSVLLAPLFMPISGKRMGLLVLSSNRPRRFVAGMGTMFLTQLTELIENIFASSVPKEQHDD